MKPKDTDKEALPTCARLHMRLGWWSQLMYLSLGLVLEGLHAFKIAWYLDVARKTQRLMWTLAHAHGTLLAVLQIVFAATIHLLPGWDARSLTLASRSLLGAALLMPLGFFLGGLYFYAGVLGVGALLVPPGGVLLLLAIFLTACAVQK